MAGDLVASLFVELGMDTKKYDKGLGQARKGTKSWLGSLKGGLGTAAVAIGGIGLAIGAATGAVSGLVNAVSEWTTLAREQIAAEKQLEQVIKSTGGAAGLTADELKKMASELQNVTNFGDEATIKGQALLLTFTNIGKEVFPRATETMLDMSAALDQDLKQSAIQLGKALNDPIKGVGALSRVGIQFTEEQKKMIKEMVKMGDVAGAQTVILDELATQFGGQARALADPVIQLNNAWGDLKETLGMAILPLLNAIAQAALPGISAAIEALGEILTPLGEALGNVLGPIISESGQAVAALISALGGFAAALKEVVVGLGLASEDTHGLTILLSPLLAIIKVSVAAIKVFTVVTNIMAGVLKSVAFVINIVRDVIGGLSINTRTLKNDWGFLVNLGKRLTGGFRSLKTWIDNLNTSWQNLINTMKQRIQIPNWLTPGSPTPLEIGIRGISDALKKVPDVSQAFNGQALTPALTGQGGSTVIVNVDGVSATTNGSSDPGEDAIKMTSDLLRQQISRRLGRT